MYDANGSHADTVFSKRLLGKGVLINPERKKYSEMRFKRDDLFASMLGANPAVHRDRLEHHEVAIVGCGGIGNAMSAMLATQGVGKLVLIDADKVEAANLTRQLMFTEADIGSLKITALARSLSERNHQVQIQCIEQHITAAEHCACIGRPSLVIASADEEGVASLINAYCVENRIPWINIGYIDDLAAWGPTVIPGVTACLACNEAESADPSAQALEVEASVNGRYEVPSSPVTNNIAAAFALLDVLGILDDQLPPAKSLGRRMMVSVTELKILALQYERKAGCKVCGLTV